MKSTTLEALARGLSIFTFILICWVAHRTLQVRESCVTSSFIAYVQLDGRRVDNCHFESRLNLSPLSDALSRRQRIQVQALEVLEPLAPLFPAGTPHLVVEVSAKEPRAFELGQNGLRLGEAWLNDPVEARRALIMAVLKSQRPEVYNQFQLEVLTDFLLLSTFSDDGRDGRFSLRKDARFPTVSLSMAQYCRSPFRSIAHYGICQLPEGAVSQDDNGPRTRVWGLRPLLASALWRIYDKLPLREQIAALQAIQKGQRLPSLPELEDDGVESLAAWFNQSLSEYASSLGMTAHEDKTWALKRTLKELDVEAPTHWELTVDVTRTPAWKEIVEQLKTRSRYRHQERALVFTPEGEVALPSGLPVAWNAHDVQSQKHVLIACDWPRDGESVHIQARQMFAQKSCAKLNRAFWD